MSIIRKAKRFIQLQKNVEKGIKELLWARTWEDTKRGINWLDELPSISPGRWAVGYNYIYIMTRVLEEMEPESVLDLGLGISSTLISCYFNHRKNGIHTIVEQDKEWAHFYTENHSLSKFSQISILECIKKDYKGQEINAYSGFDDLIRRAGMKYSVVSIDGPWGSDRYSRRDIVPWMPDILEDDFAILMDDANRKGEKETAEDIMNTLKQNNMEYAVGYYPGECDCLIICSKKYSFLCSL